jgi:hypothetical protein
VALIRTFFGKQSACIEIALPTTVASRDNSIVSVSALLFYVLLRSGEWEVCQVSIEELAARIATNPQLSNSLYWVPFDTRDAAESYIRSLDLPLKPEDQIRESASASLIQHENPVEGTEHG